jgi:hypothetical protein
MGTDKNTTTIFDLTDEEIDIYLKDAFIKQLVKISQEVKYSDWRLERKEKPLTKLFLGNIRLIEDNSLDITQDYICEPIIGLSLAGEYGENARDCFHKICKANKAYNYETCNKAYTKYLKNNTPIISVYFISIFVLEAISESFKNLIYKKENEKRSCLCNPSSIIKNKIEIF